MLSLGVGNDVLVENKVVVLTWLSEPTSWPALMDAAATTTPTVPLFSLQVQRPDAPQRIGAPQDGMQKQWYDRSPRPHSTRSSDLSLEASEALQEHDLEVHLRSMERDDVLGLPHSHYVEQTDEVIFEISPSYP